MSVYIRTGRAWGIGLPFWLAVWLLPLYLAWVLLALTWNVLVVLVMIPVWVYRSIQWLRWVRYDRLHALSTRGPRRDSERATR